MFLSILTIASIVLLFVLGFRFDAKTGLEQGALLQFNSRPAGAWVSIDGDILGSVTPTKSSVTVGHHTVTMGRDGYETWTKSLTLPPGTLTWLDYALLVPSSRPVEGVLSFPTVASMLPAPSKRFILVQQNASVPSFNLVDIRNEAVKSTTITLTASQYTASKEAHTFTVDRWDDQGRYVLVQHAFGKNKEWLVIDTQNPEVVRNVSAAVSGAISSLRFVGNNGAVFYGIVDGNLRRINLGNNVTSSPIAQGVVSFELYSDDVVAFIAADANKPGFYIAATVTGDDTSAYVYARSPSLEGFGVATARYYNNNYVAVALGTTVTLYKGRYPQSATDATAMVTYGRMTLMQPMDTISFSPGGNYLVAQSGKQLTTYDIERKAPIPVTVTADAATIPTLEWLNGAYLVGAYDGELAIREYDGANFHIINDAVDGFDATLSINGRFLYSLGQTADDTYSLQRVKMIID